MIEETPAPVELGPLNATDAFKVVPKSRGKRQSVGNRQIGLSGFTNGILMRRKKRIQQAGHLLNDRTWSGQAAKNPFTLLRELPAIHPTVGLAQWNALRLMFPQEDWGIRAYKTSTDGVQEPDAVATQSIELMLTTQAPELGGIHGLADTLGISLLYSGMAAIECVPFTETDKSFSGVRRVWPVDALTVDFVRPDNNSDLVPVQWQMFPLDGNYVPRFVPLNPETFLWATIDNDVNDPFGLAPYGTALNEVLADLALMRDLRDAIHNAAWPRMKIGINLAELHRVAVEVYRITDPVQASAWVKARFDEAVGYAESLAPDDNIVSDTTGKVESHEPGSFTGLEGVLQFLRQRLIQALKSLPSLLGINDGSTFNYTSVEWAIYAAGLEAMREIILDLIARACTLHLRLQGSTSIAKPYFTKLRTNDSLVAANTMEVQIRSAMAAENAGFMTHDQASESVTGRPAVADAKPLVAPGAAASVAQSDKDQSKKPGHAGGKPGMSQEEKNTAKP